MLLLERVLVGGAQRHHRRHVHFVEGGELGGGVLGFLQAQRDGLAQPRHRHLFLARLIGARPVGTGRGRGGHGLRRAGAGCQRPQHVALGDAAIACRCRRLMQWQCRILRRDALGRRHGRRVGFADGAGAAGCRRGSRGGLGRLGFWRSGSWRRRSAGFAFGDGAQQRAHLHGGAGLDDDRFNRAIGRRGHFHRHLVGLQLQQRLVALDRIAFLLEPVATVASVTDSPIAGTLISMVMKPSSACRYK